jgi:chromate transporter
MADGLGLAETTPGPLILVTQFVGYLAAFRAPEPFSPLVAGLLGALLTTWVTFAPCFLWIFTFAPWIERLEQAVKLKGALAAVTAAVVGVIASLALWFAGHLLFPDGDLARLDWRAALLALLSAALLFGLKWGVLRVLVAAALGGLALAQF